MDIFIEPICSLGHWGIHQSNYTTPYTWKLGDPGDQIILYFQKKKKGWNAETIKFALFATKFCHFHWYTHFCWNILHAFLQIFRRRKSGLMYSSLFCHIWLGEVLIFYQALRCCEILLESYVCHYVKVNWPFEWVVHSWCFAQIPFRFTAAQLQTTSFNFQPIQHFCWNSSFQCLQREIWENLSLPKTTEGGWGEDDIEFEQCNTFVL